MSCECGRLVCRVIRPLNAFSALDSNLCVYLQEVKNGARIITRPQTTSVTDGARPFMWVLAMVDALYSSGVLSYKLWQAGWSRPANNRNGLGRKLVAILRGAFIVSISSAVSCVGWESGRWHSY